MTDLQIDAAALEGVSAQILSAADDVVLDGASHWEEGALGSADVAAALRDVGVQQRARSQVTVSSLRSLGRAPSAAAEQFRAADSKLVKAF